ncbi:MAG: EamA family transporter [Nakamurella sp.]
MPSPRNLIDVTPAPALFLVSGFTQYYGAALAVGLFVLAPSAVVGWLRILVSAAILLAWRRPWRQAWTRRELLASAAFGCVLAAMNLCFYVAIDHLPLGTAVAIEFLGPVAVAAVTGAGWRDRLGIVLALGGVVLLAGVSLESGWTSSVVIGLIAIMGSGLFWAFYIVLGRRIASSRDGITSLSVGMTAGAVLFTPLCVWQVGGIVTDARAVLALIGIAVLSSVIPYALEQVVLRKVAAARFAILLALLPVTAAITGAIFLAQVPHPAEIIGTGLVCAAIVLSAGKARGELATG